MKVLFLTLCLVTLASCGNKDDSTPAVGREGEGYNCGGRNANLCIAPNDYVIVSHQALPSKIKISRTLNNHKFVIFNECDGDSDFTVERNGTFDRILFEAHRGLLHDGVQLEIVDLGASCDNNAIFFDQVITPEVSRVGNRTLSRITLNN
jgi:hypothetical protein